MEDSPASVDMTAASAWFDKGDASIARNRSLDIVKITRSADQKERAGLEHNYKRSNTEQACIVMEKCSKLTSGWAMQTEMLSGSVGR